MRPPVRITSPVGSAASRPRTWWRVTPCLTARIPPALVAMFPPRVVVLARVHGVASPCGARAASSWSSCTWPHDGELVVDVDLQDAVHPLEGHDDAALDRDARPGHARPAPPRRHRHLPPRTPGGRRPPRPRSSAHDGDGHHRRGRQRLVVPVVLLDLGGRSGTLSALTTAASCSMISHAPTLTRSREGALSAGDGG